MEYSLGNSVESKISVMYFDLQKSTLMNPTEAISSYESYDTYQLLKEVIQVIHNMLCFPHSKKRNIYQSFIFDPKLC